jgi:hypothetical protein
MQLVLTAGAFHASVIRLPKNPETTLMRVTSGHVVGLGTLPFRSLCKFICDWDTLAKKKGSCRTVAAESARTKAQLHREQLQLCHRA